MTIEEKIRAKKEEIKRVNRELSRLQDELKRKKDPVKVRFYNATCATGITDRSEYPIMYSVDFMTNREVDSQKIIKAIESLSESCEPNSPIDWSNPEYDGYNWAAIDFNGSIWAYQKKPTMRDYWWTANDGMYMEIHVIPWASWDKSLIHRHGIKE